MRYSIELRTSETTAEVLEKISANTEREMVPFVFAAVIWAGGDKTTETRIFIPLLCVFGLAMFASALRPRPQEETEILAFLRRLFPDSRFNVQ